jgi:tetratricopeptide (TPR) repeat protein
MKSNIHENQKPIKIMNTKIITTFVILVATVLSVNAQQFEQGMGKALATWKEGNATEASALFERIAAAEKTNWLPNYYVALVNTTEAFNPSNNKNALALINKAQTALDSATLLTQNNPEIFIMQAMINTAWIVQDPMTNGMKLSAPTIELYEKALALAPENPRAVFGKADFEIGGAQYWGTDTKPMCEQVAKSIELFAKFKPETPFHPSWGLNRAQETLKTCGK